MYTRTLLALTFASASVLALPMPEIPNITQRVLPFSEEIYIHQRDLALARRALDDAFYLHARSSTPDTVTLPQHVRELDDALLERRDVSPLVLDSREWDEELLF